MIPRLMHCVRYREQTLNGLGSIGRPLVVYLLIFFWNLTLNIAHLLFCYCDFSSVNDYNQASNVNVFIKGLRVLTKFTYVCLVYLRSTTTRTDCVPRMTTSCQHRLDFVVVELNILCYNVRNLTVED